MRKIPLQRPGRFLRWGMLGAVLLLAGFTGAAAQEARITVNAACPQGIIDSLLFGENVLFAGNGLWDSRVDGLAPAVKPFIEALAPTLLRFPGGSAADQYLWEDGLGFKTREAVGPGSRMVVLDGSPSWVGVTQARLLDTKDGQLGEVFRFLRVNGNRLEGVSGIRGRHPAGAEVRPEARPGQPEWFTNQYGIAEHLKLAQALGAQALLTVNYGSGLDREGRLSSRVSLSQRLKRAAALVAFANGNPGDPRPLGTDAEGRDWQTVGYWARQRVARGLPQPFGVRYWEVGNEVYDRQETGCTSAAQYARDLAAFARTMKGVDPDLKIGAVGLSNPRGRGDADPDAAWNPTVVKLAGDSLDFLVIHLYYPAAGPPQVSFRSPAWFTAVLAGATRALADLREIRRLVDANGPAPRKIALAVTEYGIWPLGAHDPRDFSNLAGALYYADLLLGLSREAPGLDLTLAAAWNLHGSNPTAALGYRWDLGLRTVRPQYHVLQLLRQLAGWQRLDPRVAAPTFTVPEVGNLKGTPPVPLLGALAALSGDRRRLHLLVLNRSLSAPVTAALRFQGFSPRPAARVLVLTADQITSHNEEHPSTVAPAESNLTVPAGPFTYTFRPRSLTLLNLQTRP
jgi:alpha-L-arabinofuranosidase